MIALAKVKKALSLMCVIFTVIISVMYVFGILASSEGQLLGPTPVMALLVLLFSAILGFASLLLSKEGTPAIRLALHAIVCTIAFVLVFVVGGSFSVTGDTGIIATAGFLVVYAVVMAVRAIVCRKYRRNKTESEEYTSVFK